MIELVNDISFANAITHAGSFHADDVFATIFLSRFMDVFLCRVNEVPDNIDLSSVIVFDIGYGPFDHHGENARVRENGIKYSSFGLLFETYGMDYLRKKKVKYVEDAYEMFLKDFVLQIDAIDNGIFPSNPSLYNVSSLSLIIEMFNKTWKEEKTSNDAFLEAISVGNLIFDRMEKRILDKLEAKDLVDQAILDSKNGILLLDRYLPYMDFVLQSDEVKASHLYFCIYPSLRGGFNIQAILKNKETHENRLNFPKAWGGKSSLELQQLTSVPTFRFCHVNLFLCACETLEDAKRIAMLAINEK